MKNKSLFALILIFAFAAIANAQPITTTNSPKSAEINLKIQKLELAMKILPLALSKSQYKDLERAIALARQKWRGQMEIEDKALADVDPDIQATLDAAMKKGIYPSHEFQAKIAAMNQDASIKESILSAQLTEGIYNDISKVFNVGQMKVMAGSYADKYIDPTKKPGEMKDDFKEKFYIQAVFMDPYAFDVVGDLEANAPAEPGKPGDPNGGGTSGGH